MLTGPSTQSASLLIASAQLNDSSHAAVCVYWKNDSSGGSWSKDGCETIGANQTHTVCRCYHLSSFAVLMALYEIQVFNQHQKTLTHAA